MIAPASNNTVASSNETTDSSMTIETLADVPISARFNWDEHQKQLILGSFFWGYILTGKLI